MIENELMQNIISLYDDNIKILYSINQISKKLNKPYPYINKKLKTMISKDIFTKRVIGRSYLCSLNLNNEKTVVLLTLNEINKKRELEKQHGFKFSSIIEHLHEKDIYTIVAVKKNHTIYIVSEHPKFENISTIEDEFKPFELKLITKKELHKLLTKHKHPLYSDRTVVYGFERYFESITKCDEQLSYLYSPFS